jgi:hypothetical protein
LDEYQWKAVKLIQLAVIGVGTRSIKIVTTRNGGGRITDRNVSICGPDRMSNMVVIPDFRFLSELPI